LQPGRRPTVGKCPRRGRRSRSATGADGGPVARQAGRSTGEGKISCSVMVSPSRPCTSAIEPTHPSPVGSDGRAGRRGRARFATCFAHPRGAVRSDAAHKHHGFRDRSKASRVPLAWIVVSDPSWPVGSSLAACRWPRPAAYLTRRRCGPAAIQQCVLRTEIRGFVTPTRSLRYWRGRASRPTTMRLRESELGWRPPMVMMRSLPGMKPEEHVEQGRLAGRCSPPDTRMFNLPRTAASRNTANVGRHRSYGPDQVPRSSSRFSGNLRTVRHGPVGRQRGDHGV